MKLPILFAAALSLFVAAGCGGGNADGAAPQTPKSDSPAADGKAADVKAPGEAKIGDKTSCPISKEVFTVSDASPKVDYKGKTYYFCCGGCDAKFKENPEKYLSASTTPAQ